MANPRQNAKAILMIFSGSSRGNLKANPLLLYPWFGRPTRAWTRSHDFFRNFPRASPRNCPRPFQEVCMTPATVRLGRCLRMRPGPQVTGPGQGSRAFCKTCQCNCRRRTSRICQASSKNFAMIPTGPPTNLSRVPKFLNCFPGDCQRDSRVYPRDSPEVFRQRPGEFPKIH